MSEKSCALEAKKNASQSEYDALVESLAGGSFELSTTNEVATHGTRTVENTNTSMVNQRVSDTSSSVLARSSAPSRRSSEQHAHNAHPRRRKMNRDMLIQLALDSDTMEDAKATLIEYVTSTSIADLRQVLHLPTVNHVTGLSSELARNLTRTLSRGYIHLQPELKKRLENDTTLKRLLIPARGTNVMIKHKQAELKTTLVACLDLGNT